MPFSTFSRQKRRKQDIWAGKCQHLYEHLSSFTISLHVLLVVEKMLLRSRLIELNLPTKARKSAFDNFATKYACINICWINGAFDFELPTGISLMSSCDTGRFYIGRFLMGRLLMGRFLWFGICWQYHNGQVLNGHWAGLAWHSWQHLPEFLFRW